MKIPLYIELYSPSRRLPRRKDKSMETIEAQKRMEKLLVLTGQAKSEDLKKMDAVLTGFLKAQEDHGTVRSREDNRES